MILRNGSEERSLCISVENGAYLVHCQIVKSDYEKEGSKELLAACRTQKLASEVLASKLKFLIGHNYKEAA